ncbi:MAG: hypothetical protein Q7T03_09520 [Deltaproteobacteria bacterium]|nr:hypothetical protein [Deltaproteobacteria bacterium]
MLQILAAAAVAIYAYSCQSPEEKEESQSTKPGPDTDNGTPVATEEDAGTPVARDASISTPDAGAADASMMDAGEEDAGTKLPTPVSKYVPPANPVFPALTTEGIYHHSFLEEGQLFSGVFPLSFKCNEANTSCYFGVTNKAYSFPANNLQNNDAIPVTVAADFSADIDGQNAFVAAVLQSGNYYYGLYDSFDPNAAPGISIRDNTGNSLATYHFPLVGEVRMTTPNSMIELSDQMWVSISNYVGGDDIYGPGKVFVLDKNVNGTLMEDPSRIPLTTTQLDPQAIVSWNNGTKDYVLLTNTGKAEYQGAILTESGVDVIDPASNKIVANIPLGLGTANSLAVTPDGAAAFVSSQTLSNIYVIDMERLKTKLEALDASSETPARLEDVVVADATNAVAINGSGEAFTTSLFYDDRTKSLVLSSNNDGMLIQLNADYSTIPGVGILLGENFGQVMGEYACATDQAMYCSSASLLQGGVGALTSLPVTVTYVPNESLAEQPTH